MNTEELKYYTALQGKFREAMGPISEGDRVALEFDSNSVDCGFVTQTKTLEKDIISADLVYVRWYSDKPWRDQSCDKREWADEHFIRLPLPIDPVNPERGLWGMVDWGRFDAHCGGGNLYIFETDRWSREIFDTNWKRPTLALLKALAHQWGIEVPS